jgi:hypothetical protein
LLRALALVAHSHTLAHTHGHAHTNAAGVIRCEQQHELISWGLSKRPIQSLSLRAWPSCLRTLDSASRLLVPEIGSPCTDVDACSRGRFPVSGGTSLISSRGQRWSCKKGDTPFMREVIFRVLAERPGQLDAQAEGLPIRISAPTLEELQHEAREALIQHFGAAHSTYRLRVRRCAGAAGSAIRPMRRPTAPCR